VSAANKTFALFADYDGGVQNQTLLNFRGWNWATAGGVWANLKYSAATYNFSASAKVNDYCAGVDTLNMILVKKIANWENQHANGFKKTITSSGYKYGDVTNLVIDLKINSSKTFIPEIATLKTTYASYVNGSAIDALDEGKVNIGITLYDGTSLNAATIIQLDQSILMDKWVRVTIPMKDMKFYSEVTDNRQDKTFTDLSNVVISEVLFVAETKSGVVLRNTILSNWNESTPETFKEMDLSFKKIEFQLK
jgi:hypothetical protein